MKEKKFVQQIKTKIVAKLATESNHQRLAVDL